MLTELDSVVQVEQKHDFVGGSAVSFFYLRDGTADLGFSTQPGRAVLTLL